MVILLFWILLVLKLVAAGVAFSAEGMRWLLNAKIFIVCIA